ncbi:MAG: SPASM domain-containing protein [Acidobacteriota bacterium]|nr:MAG: SPASM domain-containing protein [Acidobacteriota bacterium]
MYRYPEFPDHVYVELTNICNARCTICATPGMKRPREIMSAELFQKIVRECGERGAKKLLPFLHGESLLVPGVLDYFREARRLAPQTHINLTTNGSKLSEELTEAFLQEELLDSLIVSIDGGDKETFEGIRLGLSYDEVRSNVQYFLKRRDELPVKRPRVSISMVTVDENKHSREQLRREWEGADEVRFSVYFNWAGKLENRGRTPNKVNFCERLYHYITILADGRVAMCCFDSEADYSVGDVRTQTIAEVWNSPDFDEKRRWLFNREFDRLKICGGCDYVNHPKWLTPMLRLRFPLEETLPGLVGSLGNLYKRWLNR